MSGMDHGRKRHLEQDKIPTQQAAHKFARQYVPSDFDARRAYVTNFKTMVDDLIPTELLPWCIQFEILSPQEVDEVTAKETRRDKNFHLLCIVHHKATADLGVLNRFTGILEQINAKSKSGCLEHIVEGLRRQLPTINTSSTDYCADTEDRGHWHAVLQTMHQVICSSVDANHILPELISEEVITVTQSEEIHNGKTREQRTGLLLNMIRYCGGAKLYSFFEVLRKSNQIPKTLEVADLLKWSSHKNDRDLEAMAFKKAMGRLMASLKEDDVKKLITFLYSDDIIDKSTRDHLQSLLPHHSELVRVYNVLCCLESIIQKRPQVYGQLIEIFLNRLQLSSPGIILRECYSALVLESDNISMEERDSGSRPTQTFSPVPKFTQQLMERYKTIRTDNQKWFRNKKNYSYINLVIIKKERVTRATADPITKETIEGADLDSILQRKEPVEMQDIFLTEPGSRLHVILVQGAPGVGKSTFALEIAKKWPLFKEMRCFHVVLLIQLHQPFAHCAKSIKDLLQLLEDDSSQADSIAEFITKQQGEGLLLILDGFDELPADMTKATSDSFYNHLLKGKYLPKATIILTTRPSVIGDIEQVCDERISKNVEILGFLSTNINDYAYECFEDKEEVKRFLDYIYSHPHIKSLMYIPLNTAIVVELYRNFANPDGQGLPLTLTQLYTELCLYLLERYSSAKDKKMTIKPEPPQEEGFLSRLNYMPDIVRQQLTNIAKVAFEGITKQSLVFYDLPPDFEHMNFMNKCETLVRFGRYKKLSFNFLHLTLQEFLAAFHISMLPQEEQSELLHAHHSEPRFSHIWRFLAGLTSFRDIGWDGFAGIMGVSRCGSDMKMCNSLLANCLYEAQDPSICSQVYSSGQVVYSPMSATQYDYYSLGYCISNSLCKWKLCSIGGDGLAMLAAGIKSTPDNPKGMIDLIKLSYNGDKIGDLMKLPGCVKENLTELNLSNCDLKNPACSCLAELLPCLPNLKRLDLGDNPFSEGGATSLLHSLSKLPTLYSLDLLHAKLSVEDLKALSVLIRPGGALKNLVVGSTTMSLTAKEEMIEVVLRDSSLRSISIMNLDLAQSGSHLRRKLEENKKLDKLMLWDRSFCIEGCVEVVRALETNDALESLTLMPWYKVHIPENLFERHKKRIDWFLTA